MKCLWNGKGSVPSNSRHTLNAPRWNTYKNLLLLQTTLELLVIPMHIQWKARVAVEMDLSYENATARDSAVVILVYSSHLRGPFTIKPLKWTYVCSKQREWELVTVEKLDLYQQTLWTFCFYAKNDSYHAQESFWHYCSISPKVQFCMSESTCLSVYFLERQTK